MHSSPAVGFGATSRSNSNNFGNSAGLSQIDLRNLGTVRTLVLVDGLRHVAGDITSNAVDINSIPTALVDHVEVTTGGASAIYGSDAVSGVVNIILKHDFEGVEAQGQVGGYTNGFGQQYNVYGTVGHNYSLGDGRLNVTASAYWTKEAGIDASNIPTAHNYGLISNSNDIPPGTFDPTYYTSGTPINNNGVPNKLYVQNVGSDFVSRGGVLYNLLTGTPLTNFDAAGNPTGPITRQGYNSFAFAQLPANCGVACYFTEDYEQERTPLETKGFDFTTRYELNNHLHFGLDAKYAESDARQTLQPSYTFYDFQLQPDNAFITPAIASYLNGLTPGEYPLIGKFVDAGRTEDIKRQTFRFVGSAGGDFDLAFIGNVKWDGALNYGITASRFRSNQLIANNFIAALDSVVDPATGQAACRINVPSAQGNGFPYNGPFGTIGGGTFAEQNAGSGCVPFNPFGIHTNDYIDGNFVTRDHLSQEDATLNFTFDTGRFLNLQGGPIGFAAGGEYRMERTYETNDAFAIAGNLGIPAVNSAGGYNVYEGYIEGNAPIFKHFAPGLDELSVDAAYRGSQYSTVGHTDTYKFSGVYGPVRDLKFRGSYSQAIRAPNITEAFLPQSGTFFNGVSDPCDQTIINTNVNYAKNCAAQGIPNPFTANTNSGIPGITKGNTNLTPEDSFSYTAGFVLQPRWIPRLNVTVDYYSIKTKNAIVQVAGQDILNNCYSGAALDPQYCSLFTRGPDHNINFLQTTYVNAARLYTNGVDVQVNYNIGLAGLADRSPLTRFMDTARLNFDFTGNYTQSLRRFPFQNIPGQVQILEDTQIYPSVRFLSDLVYQQGPLQVSWQVQYLGGTDNYNRNPTQAVLSESTDIPKNKQQYTHNFVARYDLPGRLQGTQIFLGVNNAFDDQPPGYLVGTLLDTGYSLGRYVFGGIRIRH